MRGYFRCVSLYARTFTGFTPRQAAIARLTVPGGTHSMQDFSGRPRLSVRAIGAPQDSQVTRAPFGRFSRFARECLPPGRSSADVSRCPLATGRGSAARPRQTAGVLGCHFGSAAYASA